MYRLPMTAIMSISHRITGVILTGGSLLIAAFLVAAAIGPEAFSTVQTFAGTWFGTALLVAWSFVLYYHLCNGVRHIIWDTAAMLEKSQAAISGWVVIVSSIVLTALTWYCALNY